MAEELLDRVRREIRERKQAAQAADEESRRLEQALAALAHRARRQPDAADGSPIRRRSSRRRSRAAPGANREAMLAVLRERPGVTAGEIAQATGIARSTVTTTLGRLVDSGEVQRAELPGGRVGFRIREGEREDAAAIADSPEPAIAGRAPEDPPASE